MITVKIDNSFGKNIENYIYNFQSNFPLSKISKTVQEDLIQESINRGWNRIKGTVKRRVLNKNHHEVYTDNDISVYLHKGTPSHSIKAKNKKALRWFEGGVGAGIMKFAKSVKHPGTKPNPFFKITQDIRLQLQLISEQFMRGSK